MDGRPAHEIGDETARQMAEDLYRQQGEERSTPQEMSVRYTWKELLETDRWVQMDWFVRFATVKNLRALKDSELCRWRQELAAMELRARRPILPAPLDPLRYPTGEGPGNNDAPQIPLFNMEELEEFQALISPHINRLADGEGTCFGPFRLSYQMRLYHIHDHYGKVDFPRYTIYRGETTEPDDMFTGLLRHLATLAETYCDHVRRCPHCGSVFLQFRRQQRYCTRGCQSVAVMKKQRREEKYRIIKKQRAEKQTEKKLRKRGHHGKKGR
jgi:hypothetical protein